MKRLYLTLVVLLLSSTMVSAQEQPQDDIDAVIEQIQKDKEETPANIPGTSSPNLRFPSLSSQQLLGQSSSVMQNLQSATFMDVSLDVVMGAGWSTEKNPLINILQGGGHDPKQRGMTLQNVELSLSGAVDPFLRAESHIIYFLTPAGQSVLELEEAFVTTQTLPFGLQIEAGQFLTEFGRTNNRHPHSWLWQDQPVINTRLFGPDGMRGPGFRLGWLTPLPWFSEVHMGAQNAVGSTMHSFLGSGGVDDGHGHGAPIGIGGLKGPGREIDSLDDFVYLGRWTNYFDITDETFTKFGLSGLIGPNPTGNTSQTQIAGVDWILRWLPINNERGWPFVTLEAEAMVRNFQVASDLRKDLPNQESQLFDTGFYLQGLWGFWRNWATGIRYEYATGIGESKDGRAEDHFRSDRHRLSPLLVYYPSEFSRIRLQWNYDYAQSFVTLNAHSVWLGLEFLIGSHPAHEL